MRNERTTDLAMYRDLLKRPDFGGSRRVMSKQIKIDRRKSRNQTTSK
jgi:hypothetical protein